MRDISEHREAGSDYQVLCRPPKELRLGNAEGLWQPGTLARSSRPMFRSWVTIGKLLNPRVILFVFLEMKDVH